MAQQTTLYFVRHGETDWNRKQRIQGHKDISLNELGKAQAHETAKKLQKIEDNFHAIISSDLVRTAQTARIIAQYYSLPIRYTPHLRERDFGSFAGKTYKQANVLLKDAKAIFDTLTEDEQSTFVLHPEIESESMLRERVLASVQKATNNYAGKNVIFVTHGGVLRSILTAMNMLNLKDHGRIHIANAAYFAVSYQDSYKLIASEGIVFPT